jgi:hypothetical protein
VLDEGDQYAAHRLPVAGVAAHHRYSGGHLQRVADVVQGVLLVFPAPKPPATAIFTPRLAVCGSGTGVASQVVEFHEDLPQKSSIVWRG